MGERMTSLDRVVPNHRHLGVEVGSIPRVAHHCEMNVQQIQVVEDRMLHSIPVPVALFHSTFA